MMNLCTNAAHAMQADGGVLEICLEKAILSENETRIYDNLKPGDYLMLSVSDTGHGINEEDIGKIFDPFFTTKPLMASDGRPTGTGLGLASSKDMIESYKGTINVKTEPGKGSVFQVCLPL